MSTEEITDCTVISDPGSASRHVGAEGRLSEVLQWQHGTSSTQGAG